MTDSESSSSPVDNSENHIKVVNRTTSKGISVISYNLACSSASPSHDKISKICEYIKKHNINIICLQDVSQTTLTIFKSKIFGYQILETFLEENKETGTVILFPKKTFELVDPYYLECPTTMNRSIVGCKIKGDNGITYDIVNVHLEDYQYNEEYRAKQFSLITEYTNENPNTLVIGDFNIFDVSEPVNDIIGESGMKDSWIALGCPSKLRNTTIFKEVNKSIRSARVLYYTNADFAVHKMATLNLDNTRNALVVFMKDK